MERHLQTLPPLEWIRAFDAAARCGSFTAAASETGLTQSAISQRIGNLEKRIGTKLFYRRARSIELTVEGEAWLPHVRTALTTLHDSTEALFGPGKGGLTLSASQSIIQLLVLPRLSELQGVAGGRVNVQTMVLGAHDAAQDEVIRIRYGSGTWPHAYKHQLYEEVIAPLAAPALAKSADDWTRLPRIACSGPRPGWHEWSTRFGVPTTPVPVLRFDTFLSALGAAREGLGVILGSVPLCAGDIESGRLVRVSDKELPHHESYWALAGADAIRRSDWDRFCDILS